MNWDQARDQIRRSQIALDEALVPTPDRIEAVYRRRAVRLAESAEKRAVLPGLPVLVFRLGGGRYAIELADLAEVISLAGCTPVPGSPLQFLGVINVRGEIRPVLDSAHLLTPSESAVTDDSGFVVMLRREVGLKVDRIEGLGEIRPEQLTLSDRGNYVKGLTSDALMLLSVEALMARAFPKEES